MNWLRRPVHSAVSDTLIWEITVKSGVVTRHHPLTSTVFASWAEAVQGAKVSMRTRQIGFIDQLRAAAETDETLGQPVSSAGNRDYFEGVRLCWRAAAARGGLEFGGRNVQDVGGGIDAHCACA